MADTRVKGPVKIVDPTTDANQAGVDAGGNLKTISAVNTGVNVGSVDVLTVIPATGATNLGKATGAASGASDTGVEVLTVRTDTLATLTPAVGAYVPARVDSQGALWVRLNSTVVDTELPAATALADAEANPTVPAVGSHLSGFNGTTWDRVRTANTGRLQVDVVTGGGLDTPTNPVIAIVDGVAVAAGASVSLDTADQASLKKLWEVHVSASVPFKFQVQMVNNAVATNASNLLFGKAGDTRIWKTPQRNFVTVAGGTVGLDAFRVVVTNMDNSSAADVHAAFYFSDN